MVVASCCTVYGQGYSLSNYKRSYFDVHVTISETASWAELAVAGHEQQWLHGREGR